MFALDRRGFQILFVALLAGCAAEPADQAAPPDAAAAGATGPTETLERFAGRWEIHARNEAGDTLPTHTLLATPDTTGWTIDFPDRQGIPVQVVDASGDLVVFEAGPYESVLRSGVQVRVRYVTRFENDAARGSFIAMYDVSGASAILRGTTEGARLE